MPSRDMLTTIVPENKTHQETLLPMSNISYTILHFQSKHRLTLWTIHTDETSHQRPSQAWSFWMLFNSYEDMNFLHVKFHFFLKRQKAINQLLINQVAHQGVQSALISVAHLMDLNCGKTTLWSDSEQSTALHSTPGKPILCVLLFDKQFQKIFFFNTFALQISAKL